MKKYNVNNSQGYRWLEKILKKWNCVVRSHVHLYCKYANIKYQRKHYQWNKPMEEHETFNNIIWNGWIYLSIPFKVIISDMTAFKVKEIYYKLIMYFDACNKEIVGYGLASRSGDIRSYYD